MCRGVAGRPVRPRSGTPQSAFTNYLAVAPPLARYSSVNHGIARSVFSHCGCSSYRGGMALPLSVASLSIPRAVQSVPLSPARVTSRTGNSAPSCAGHVNHQLALPRPLIAYRSWLLSAWNPTVHASPFVRRAGCSAARWRVCDVVCVGVKERPIGCRRVLGSRLVSETSLTSRTGNSVSDAVVPSLSL